MNPVQIQKRHRSSTALRTKTVLVDNFFYGQANRRLSAEVVPHLGLMSLASVLEGAGQAVEICDPKLLFGAGKWSEPGTEFLDAWAEDLLCRNADSIGFTAYGRSLPYVIRVAERIKRFRPKLPIVLGGPHATIVGDKILRKFNCFDAVVRYEAEPLIVDLVAAISQQRDPGFTPNLVYRKGGEIFETPKQIFLSEMDSLPELALHLYPIEQLRLAELSIEAGRGCPFDCTFCSTSRFFQRRYRLKSNARMLHEMETARARYGINVFNLNHDLFGLVKKSVYEFCDMARGRDFDWKCSMRTDTVDSKLVSALAAAGCRHIYFGVETGSARLQKTIRKRLKLNQTSQILREVVGSGIHCTTSFITGFPEETSEDQDQSLDMIGELLRINPQRVLPQLHVLSPEPGSALAERTDPVTYDGIGPEVDELVDDELIQENPQIFSVFYHYQSATPRWRIIMASAFISHLVPEVGYPLTTYIVNNFFNASLASLFRAIVRKVPNGKLPFQSILRVLREGLDSALHDLGSDASYLGELVRLSRVLSAIKDFPVVESAGGATEPGGETWLVRFDCDVLALARMIMRDPERRLLASEVTRGENWVLLDYKLPDSLKTGSLGIEPGRWMSMLNSPYQVMLGHHGQLFRELGVDRIRC